MIPSACTKHRLRRDSSDWLVPVLSMTSLNTELLSDTPEL
jgi:hypothetical protein